jgi:hypothetical protein
LWKVYFNFFIEEKNIFFFHTTVLSLKIAFNLVKIHLLFRIMILIQWSVNISTNLVCYPYFHWLFNPECQHIFGKQTGYICTFSVSLIWAPKNNNNVVTVTINHRMCITVCNNTLVYFFLFIQNHYIKHNLSLNVNVKYLQ